MFVDMREEDLLDKPVHDIFHPAEIQQSDCPLCEHIHNRSGPASHDIYYADKQVWHRTSLTPMHTSGTTDELLQIGVDITELLQTKPGQADDESTIYSLLAKMPVIYYQIDRNGAILNILGAALSKLDINKADITSLKAHDIFSEIHKKYDTIIQHGQYFFESHHTTSEGEVWFFHYIFCMHRKAEFVGFALDVTSMKRAQRAMFKLSADKRKLARHLLQMQENVRQDVARELHDDVGQSITAVRILASAMVSTKNMSPEFYQQNAETISDITDRMYDSAHELMYRLRPVVLDTLGMEAALNACIQSSGLHAMGVDINLVVEGEIESMEQLVQLTVFRIVQEALTNVAKYAKASTVQIKIVRRKTDHQEKIQTDLLELQITDDGIGIQDDQYQNKHSMGILGLRERVQALGGILNISSQPGEGLTLFTRINLNTEQAE